MSLEKYIKNWVSIDNEVKKYHEYIKNLRLQRNDIAEDILIYVKNNNLENTTIQISDGRLKFNNTKITPPLTFKFVKTCLNDCISDQKTVENIIEYIKQKDPDSMSSKIKIQRL